MEKYIVFILLMFGAAVFGQTSINNKLYGYFDGMPSEEITYVYKSREGILYMAAKKGLVQFDGYRFDITDTTHQAVQSAFFLNDRLVYEDGQALFSKSYAQSGKPEMLQKKKTTDSDPNNDHFKNLFVDSKGRIWCSDFNHIKYLNNSKVTEFELFPGNKYLNIKIDFIEIN